MCPSVATGWQAATPGSCARTVVTWPERQDPAAPPLFVVDGAAFTSSGWQNPTMTILSLSMRASEYLASEMKKQNL